ncbi:Rap1-interacting factor 1 N terminal-domain-containing protein [Xylariales sp. AK1849]|nr:Rap1-interacting factor 1 N terminal-domain-containing protein [Xylariales sp. AK1849]
MVPQVIVQSSLETLPARPPTPPREKTQHLLARHSLDSRRSLYTPPDYSPDSSDLSNPTSRRIRKKVGFSSQTEYCEAPTYITNVRKQPTPVSASSITSLPKPVKSILKPSPPVTTNPLDPSAGTDEAIRYVNIVMMLESTIKQLAGADRESKLDAYMMLVRALKVSNNLPDRIALQDKMGLFMQFIQRDVTTKTTAGNVDSSLSNHASTLLITFLNYPAIASTLSNDFGVFIIDHCIRSFEDVSVPKDVVRHLMQAVASQYFPPKVMTADRVGRLVTSLHRIEEHLKGKSIIMSRIIIYRRLIRQAKSHMTAHSDWLLDLFTDMLSSVKEIRASAIALGLEASFSIGKEKQISRRVMEILQLTVDETKYIEYYVGRLRTMAKGKDKLDSAAVPQIWSVVILLMRCPVDRWEFFGPWLEIIQLCFNSGDFNTKFEANYAWNRLVYSLQLNEQSLQKTITTVCQPFLSQLKRKAMTKQGEELRRIVLGSVCNLYYYAFKPNTSPSNVDSFWDSCVPLLMQKLVSPEADGKAQASSSTGLQDHTHQATQILTGLFDSSTPRIWKEDHIAVAPLVKTEELPSLDPKWVRRNATKVFAVVEPILAKTFLDLSNSGSASAKLWRTLVGAVAFAASKEVKVSTDTAVFMANAYTLLSQIWSRGIQGLANEHDASQRFFEATRVYLSTVIDALGLLPFTEKQLALNKANTFIPVATPSRRPSKGQGLTRTPLHHLFSILSSLPPGVNDDDDLSNLFRTIFTPFFAPKSSRAKLDLGHELMQSLPMDTLAPYGPWVFVAELICGSMENSQASHSSTHSGSELPVGHEYREVVKHLERSLRSIPNLPLKHWQSLFQVLVMRAVEETGEAGCAIAVIEPSAKAIIGIISNDHGAKINLSLFQSSIELLSSARHPRDRQAVDAARRRLWGTSISGSRSASFDTYDNLYLLINRLLHNLYRQYDEYDNEDTVVSLLTEVAGFLARSNQLLVFKTMVILQDSICLWIQDVDERYDSRQSSRVSEAVKLLWNRICNVFIEADNLGQIQLDIVEPLLCSAFESKHRHIVSTVSTMWNRAFEQADEVQYPERLKNVLLSLRPYVDIVLPGLDVSSYESNGPQPMFIESQDDIVDFGSSSKRDVKTTPRSDRPSSSRQSRTPASVKLSLPTKRGLENTPDASRPKSARCSVTPRLRHDDSQVQFAAIESSSPSHDAMESQVLTERQKEVRERQQENAALFPEIRSSAEKSKSKQAARKSHSPETPKTERAATPKSHRSFEDYVSLTPTPRRGQAPPMDDIDHEMTDDFPSSPPEPRRYPLVPEINKPQSSSSSLLDEWQFLSSPISGSPRPNRQLRSNKQQPAVAETPQDLVVDKPDFTDPEQEDAAVVAPVVLDDKTGYAEVEDETEYVPIDQPEFVLPPVAEGPTTPSRMRMLKVQETPRSDNEIFVDALTSPAPHTPRALRSMAKTAQRVTEATTEASRPNDQSFEASDVDERSLLRLVVELDSRKCEPMPPNTAEAPAAPRNPAESPVLDCITVNTGEKKHRRKSKKAQSGHSSSPAVPSPSVEVVSSQGSGKPSKNKRRRASQQSQEPSSKKRRHSKDDNADIDAIPDSQLLPVNDNFSLEHSEISGEERPSSSSQEFFNHRHRVEEHAAMEASGAADSPMNESEAVNLQIVQEASQSEEVPSLPIVEPSVQALVDTDVHFGESAVADVEMEVDPTEEHAEEEIHITEEAVVAPQPIEEAVTPIPETSPIEKIIDALRGGLAELRTAALSRQEVYQVEDMFMDIKRELYEAEARGRN